MPRSVRMVGVGGQHLRVAVRPGDGTRTPLVLANGIGASLELLQPFVDALDPSIEVLRFDVPGVGGSPLPRAPYRLPGLARLVARLLDQLGYPTVDLLGISWGGGLAQQFALSQGGRCRRLVLVAAGTGWSSMPLLPWIRQPTLLLAGDDDPIIPLINARIMRRLLPNAELHVYHGGHLGLLTEAAELAPIVDRFLRRATQTARTPA